MTLDDYKLKFCKTSIVMNFILFLDGVYVFVIFFPTHYLGENAPFRNKLSKKVD